MIRFSQIFLCYFISSIALLNAQTNHLSVELMATSETDAAIQGSAVNNALNQTYGVRGFSDGIDGAGVLGQGRTGVFAQGGDYGVFAVGTFRAGYFSGDLEYTGSIIGPVSDIRLKKFIDAQDAYLDIIEKLNIVKFKYKTDEYPGLHLSSRTQYGVIAQDLEKVIPELVFDSANKGGAISKKGNEAEDLKTVNYVGLIPITIAGVQELHQQIKNQEQRINQLEGILDKLTKEMSELKDQ